MSSDSDDDLPCILESQITGKSNYEQSTISFQELVQDKIDEDRRQEIRESLRDFRLSDDEEEEEVEEAPQTASQTEEPEVLCYGVEFLLDTPNRTLPDVKIPAELSDIISEEKDRELLPVLLRWAPFLKESFAQKGIEYYQVWLFGLVCYDQDVDVSNLAADILISDIERSKEPARYVPSTKELRDVLEDYGAPSNTSGTVVPVYSPLTPPPYLANLRNMLSVYSTAVRKSERVDLGSVISGTKLAVQLVQDKYVTSSRDVSLYSNVLSNLFDALDAGSFSSLQIDQISNAITGEIPTIQLAPAVCQVIRSGNPRCHLILEQVSLLVLSRYAGFKLPCIIEKGMERPRLHKIIQLIADKKISEDRDAYYGEFSAMTAILDYHMTQAVIDNDQLADIQPALYRLYTKIKEDKDSRMCVVRTNIAEMFCITSTRAQMRQDALTMF